MSSLAAAALAALPLFLLAAAADESSRGNTRFESYDEARGALLTNVFDASHRATLYSGVSFDSGMRAALPAGFASPGGTGKRARRVEATHIVPPEHYGKTFPEWRSGDPSCSGKNGRAYKGRKCAEKANREFRLMNSDLHNLYSAIGSVVKGRMNFEFAELPSGAANSFGSCAMKIQGGRAEPPESSRGISARAYLYMASGPIRASG